ncbi:ER degradation-enhancing alpha-mannosidase-like protein 2 [Amphibalanus amphitrite]|uniref:alpha-1,2-Mannosidase n=1 Tax=Amphibalanus amphitrite TaxID=1232801 RepID=A0A6A4VSZ3_AMPAM|nr:ER degradation-enhancing alpha-mannosidase-like protein 2 [Amphibalanus amphitrite]KAF0293831.1 ER degradation-enhancing alpha-mannosidase-like protein 2 [Amphibalanus amphitrite]KAF0293832.1 ER degradation-enhancing alpha-mannosidase-like protein 2 [Amphibalanus amphitrite]
MNFWYSALCLLFLHFSVNAFEEFTRERLARLREEVREMFQHSYEGYLRHAYPLDELRPLTCDGIDTWGSYSLTLIDALDTLAVMGNNSEFRRVAELIVTSHSDMDLNINVSVFETNIRVVGGLLSAHLMLDRGGAPLPPGWPCNGPLLALAVDVADRILPAFDTPTGMPYGTVNLRYGVPPGETPITCTAGVGTFIVEFGTLSRLTGDSLYERVALRALYALWERQSTLGLFGNHINVLTGKWTALDAGIGAGVDSYYEYLVKGSQLLQRPELAAMFEEGRRAVDKHVRRDDWHMWVSMSRGQVTIPVFQSLEAFWPGLLSLVGDDSAAMGTLHNYFQVWKQFGFTPEFYNIPHGEPSDGREGYPLRPELVESLVYLYRSTRNPTLLRMGEHLLHSIQHSARTRCGYATVKNVRTHALDNRMESFFLAETTKYLYLLFDPDNFLHNPGSSAVEVDTPRGPCVLHAGGYVFNTEAHPMDPAALACCSSPRLDDILQEITDDPRHRRFKLFGGRPVRPRPPPVATAVCRRPTLQELIAELASPRRLSDAARADSEQRCLRHLEIMRDPAAERSYERLRCDRPPFEDRLLVLNEVFTS